MSNVKNKIMMRKIIIAILTLLVCNFATAQLTSFYVTPYETDNAYPSSSDSNYVAINTNSSPFNKLLFYIGGTNSSPKRTTYFLDLAANLGYHAISLTYPNTTSIQSACGSSSDTDCYKNFRQEACYGTPLNGSINIDTLNSLNTRAIKLIQYLDIQYPSHNWGQFLNGNSLDWNKIVTSGHSQGAGHALYFAKTNNIDRCVMFSGANDYSNYYGRPADWLTETFITQKNKIFSFLHLQDEGMPSSYDQFEILDTLGMLDLYDTVLVDNSTVPFNDSHTLYTNETPESMAITPYHNATVIDFWTPLDNSNDPLFMTVWTYLLTSTITTSISEHNFSKKITIYPNPASNILHVEIDSNDEAFIYNSEGRIVKRVQLGPNENAINTLELSKGIYYIKIGSSVNKLIKN